jgi:hypothetical protein
MSIDVNDVPLIARSVRSGDPGVVVTGVVAPDQAASRTPTCTSGTAGTILRLHVPHVRSLADFDGPSFMDVGIGVVWVRFTPPR